MATMKDIARAAGVSEAAVSMALRGKKGVSKEMARKIQELARQMNYRPNLLAQGLAKGATRSIGLVVPDIENPYYASLVRSILDGLLRHGYHMMLGVSNENPLLERQVVDNFLSSRVDGVIVAPVNVVHDHTAYLEELYLSGTPVAFVTSRYPDTTIPYAMVDLEEGAYRLVSYLLRCGYRRIFSFSGDCKLLPYSCRREGYIRAYEECGINHDPEWFVPCNYVTFEGAYQAANALLDRTEDVDAIITSNDIMALGVLRALHERQLAIPGDIAVAGFDNTLYSTISSLPLTTVSQNINRMSQAAIGLLLRQLQAPNERQLPAPLIKPELIVRETTAVHTSI